MFRCLFLRLMAGDRSSLDSEEMLKAILKAGVTCIVPGQHANCHVNYVGFRSRVGVVCPKSDCKSNRKGLQSPAIAWVVVPFWRL